MGIEESSVHTPRVCPVCGQTHFAVSTSMWVRDVFVACIDCTENRKPELRSWIDGWDAAINYAARK